MEGEEALATRLAKTKDATMKRIYEEIGPTMLLDTLRNLYLGRDQYGRPLTEPYETREGQKMLAYLEEAAKVFEPGISRDVRKLKKSLEETKGKIKIYKDILKSKKQILLNEDLMQLDDVDISGQVKLKVLEKYDENDIVINKMDFMKILLKYKVVNNFGNINDWLKSTFGNIISE